MLKPPWMQHHLVLGEQEDGVAALTGFIRERDLARELGLTVWALRAWRRRGYGPPASKVGRIVVYRASDVDAFMENLEPAGGSN
jgi:hypothetical protein